MYIPCNQMAMFNCSMVFVSMFYSSKAIYVQWLWIYYSHNEIAMFNGHCHLIGLRDEFHEHSLIFMGKSMVSGEDFPLNQPIDQWVNPIKSH